MNGEESHSDTSFEIIDGNSFHARGKSILEAYNNNVHTGHEVKNTIVDDELRIWQMIPIGLNELEEASWKRQATPSEYDEKTKFDQQISEITTYLDIEKNLKRSDLVNLARRLLGDKSYNKYAVAGALGPSVIMDLIEQNPNTANSFSMATFVHRLANPTFDKNESWMQKCRTQIATELDRYATPELDVDITEFLDSESLKMKLSTFDQLGKVIPDFDSEEFLAEACEERPGMVCGMADNFLKLGVNFPITEIVSKFSAETKQTLKDQPDYKWKHFYYGVFERNIVKLQDNYDKYGMLSKNDALVINSELNQLYFHCFRKIRKANKNLSVSEVLQETIDSFNQKYQQYQDEFIKLRRKYTGHDIIADIGSFDERYKKEKELTETTFNSLNDDELSYFRREFIRRSFDFDGTETSSNSEILDETTRLSGFELFRELHNRDQHFFCSDEYLAFKDRKNEELRKKVSELTPEELNLLRQQHLEYELYGTEPISYIDDDGKTDWAKYDQNSERKNLWHYDTGWEESIQYQILSDKQNQEKAHKAAEEWAELTAKYPNIFGNVDFAAIKQRAKETLEMIPLEKIHEIAKLKASGKYRKADQVEVDLFTEIFNLDSKPELQYGAKNICGGNYSHPDRRLVVRRLFSGKDDEKRVDQIIAHEMWHAYQFKEEDHNTELGKKYKINSDHYQQGNPSWINSSSNTDDLSQNPYEVYDRYRNQLLEAEAFVFGEMFADYASDVINNTDPE